MSNEIEVKLVLDSTQLNGGFDTPEFGDAVEQVFHDRSSFVADLTGLMNVVPAEDIADYVFDSYSFDSNVESIVESYIGNSDLYYLPDTVSYLQHTLEEYDLMQMQDDLNRDEEAIDDLKDRLETIEEKLGTDWSEEDNREISRLQDRVLKLEEDVAKLLQINERQAMIIKNIQGVTIT